jgi:O-antigen/teichoic acid export membrane protein
MALLNPLGFMQETVTDAARIFTRKEGLRSLHRISLYRNAVYLMVNSLVLFVTGFFFWVGATRLYPVAAVGLASAAISAIGLLSLFATLGLDFGLIRFLAQSEGKAGDMINSCFTLGGLVSILVAVIYLAGINIWSPELLAIRESPIFFIAFVVTTVFYTLQGFSNQTFVAKRRAGLFLGQSIIFGILRFVPLVILAAFSQFFGIFVSLSLAVGVAMAVGIFVFLPRAHQGYRPSPRIKKKIISDMMRFSSANYAANIFWLLPQFVLPLMVVSRLGAEPNAFFYVGWSVGSVLFMIPTATSFSLFAEGSHAEEKLGSEVKRSLKLLSVLLIPAVIICILFGDKILLIFGGAYSENATGLLRILAINALPMSFNYIYIAARRVQKRMRGVVVLTALLAVITLVASYLLLPLWGIVGAGAACLLSQGVLSLIILYSFMRRGGAGLAL